MIRTTMLALMTGGVLLAQGTPDVLFERQTFEYVAGELLGGSPVKGAPYSAQAVTETTQTLADGNRISRNSSSMVYRDTLGRERREQALSSLGGWNVQGEPTQTIFISDPVAGVSYELNPKSHTARKMPAPPPLPGALMSAAQTGASGVAMIRGGFNVAVAPPPAGAPPHTIFFQSGLASARAELPAPKIEQLGTMTIEGVQAEGTRTTVTIAAGQIGNDRPIEIVSERWVSPELKATVLSKQSDPRTGQTVYRLTQINRSEPLHSLFEVPPDYTVTDAPTMIKFQSVQGKPEE